MKNLASVGAGLAIFVLAHSASAAPRFLDDCLAKDSTIVFRIESCSFALQADQLDDDQRVQALLSRSRGYTAKMVIQRSTADLEQAKQLAPDDPEVTAALADLSHFMSGRQDRAIAGYKQELAATKDNDADTLMKLGMSYVMAEDFASAQKAFDKILASQPDNVQALLWRSTTYTHVQQYDKALADLDHAVGLDPNNIQARQWRAEAELYVGNFSVAIADMDIALAKHAKAPLYRFRGIAKYAKGDFAGAAEDFGHDLNFGPVYAHLAVWRFLADKRRGAGSDAEIKQIMPYFKDAWPVPLYKFVLGQETADDVLTAAVSNDPVLQKVRQSEAHCIIGEWLTIAGDAVSAKPHFQASRNIGAVFATAAAKAEHSVIPPDTIVEFALASARLKEQKP